MTVVFFIVAGVGVFAAGVVVGLRLYPRLEQVFYEW